MGKGCTSPGKGKSVAAFQRGIRSGLRGKKRGVLRRQQMSLEEKVSGSTSLKDLIVHWGKGGYCEGAEEKKNRLSLRLVGERP